MSIAAILDRLATYESQYILLCRAEIIVRTIRKRKSSEELFTLRTKDPRMISEVPRVCSLRLQLFKREVSANCIYILLSPIIITQSWSETQKGEEEESLQGMEPGGSGGRSARPWKNFLYSDLSSRRPRTDRSVSGNPRFS